MCASASFAQIPKNKLIEEFRRATNDSLFVTAHSISPYEKRRIDLCWSLRLPNASGSAFSVLDSLYQAVGNNGVSAPIVYHDSTVYLKIVEGDSVQQYHIAQFMISNKMGKERSKALADSAFTKICEGETFETWCEFVNGTDAVVRDCDNGWFCRNELDPQMEAAIFAHRKGDIFLLELEKYGALLVKILDEPVKKLGSYSVIPLVLKNKE